MTSEINSNLTKSGQSLSGTIATGTLTGTGAGISVGSNAASGIAPKSTTTQAAVPLSDNISTGSLLETTNPKNNNPKNPLYLEENLLPVSLLTRVAKGVLNDVAISKDAKEALSRACTVFISYLTSTALAMGDKKAKTISVEHIYHALVAMEFEGSLLKVVREATAAHSAMAKEKRDDYRKRVKIAKMTGGSGSHGDGMENTMNEDEYMNGEEDLDNDGIEEGKSFEYSNDVNMEMGHDEQMTVVPSKRSEPMH